MEENACRRNPICTLPVGRKVSRRNSPFVWRLEVPCVSPICRRVCVIFQRYLLHCQWSCITYQLYFHFHDRGWLDSEKAGTQTIYYVGQVARSEVGAPHLFDFAHRVNTGESLREPKLLSSLGIEHLGT